MATSNITLRLEILRDARDNYEACKRLTRATEAERMLYVLKEMECGEMIRELMAYPRPLGELLEDTANG